MAGSLHCVVVTPERALIDIRAEFVAIPMHDGEVGVMPGRAPLIGRLGCGELRIKSAGSTHRFFVDGGFAQVRDNEVTLLTSRAKPEAEIQPEAVRTALASATEGLKNAKTPEAQDAQLAAQERARAQLRVASHRKA